MNGLIVDNFAGAGGASTGIEAAMERKVDLAVNHDSMAIEVHRLNHPDTRHIVQDIWEVDPREATGKAPVDLGWFSPDCKHFSRAKGGKPVSRKIRGLAWVVTTWAKAVRPKVIIMENVLEFQDWGPLNSEGRPAQDRKGWTFKLWLSRLKNLGYRVEFKPMIAADYGAPTIRKRFFLVARSDGGNITFPERTHWPRKKAPEGVPTWRAAADCIDWTLPCQSIFDRRRPLAEATMRRIALGLKKYVLENPKPFIVTLNHSGDSFRGNDLADPMMTLTGSRDAHGLIVPTLIQSGYGERAGQDPRTLDLFEPMGTVVAGGSKHALIATFLNKHFTGVIGSDLRAPLGTVTAIDHHSITAAWLTKFYGTSKGGQDMRDPMPATTAQGFHVAQVRAFLIKYYSSGGQDQNLFDPAGTITERARLGLVMVRGEPWQIVDIGLRMLTPEELLNAQFGRFAKGYKLIGSQARKISAIGNSVCPEVAEAIVRANMN